MGSEMCIRDRYKELSAIMMNTFQNFSPSVEPLSLDEAFLDMSGAEAFFGSPESIGQKIKQAVFDATRLHLSVGVAGTKYVAKVASGHDKPNGLTVVEPASTVAWLAPLAVEKLWGVGPVTARKLRAEGIFLIGDIAALDERTLIAKLGSMGSRLFQLANGIDSRRVAPGRVAPGPAAPGNAAAETVAKKRVNRSIGSDRTLTSDISNPHQIAEHLKRAADRIARRVRAKQLLAGGIRVRLKTTTHQLISRQCQLHCPSDTAHDFFTAAKELLTTFNHPGPFRLVGMAVFNLRDRDTDSHQLELFSAAKPRQLEVAIDDVKQRFGANSVVRGKDMGQSRTLADGVNLDFLDSTD